MVVVPLTKRGSDLEEAPRVQQGDSLNWMRVAAAGTLAASGVLLASGRRKAGLAAAVSGVTLAMLDQKETVRAWWAALPGCLAEMQEMLNHAQGTVKEITAQRERLHRIFSR
jgi:hypothetical protein